MLARFREHEVNFPVPHVHFHRGSLLHAWCSVYNQTHHHRKHARWVILLFFAGKAHVAESTYHKQKVFYTLPGTADPESLEKLRISTWTVQAFSFTKHFDLLVLTQLSFPKQPVSRQKVRNKLTLYFFQMDLRYIMEVNSVSSEKNLFTVNFIMIEFKNFYVRNHLKAATNLKYTRTSPLVGYIMGEGSYSVAGFSWIMYKPLRETELRAQRAQA